MYILVSLFLFNLFVVVDIISISIIYSPFPKDFFWCVFTSKLYSKLFSECLNAASCRWYGMSQKRYELIKRMVFFSQVIWELPPNGVTSYLFIRRVEWMLLCWKRLCVFKLLFYFAQYPLGLGSGGASPGADRKSDEGQWDLEYSNWLVWPAPQASGTLQLAVI